MNIAQKIEHTLLKADCNHESIRQLIKEAGEHHFAGVCVPPYFVKEAFRQTENTPLKLVTVVGFPMGYNTTPVKAEEAKRAIDEGADEIDVVINIAAVKCGDWNYVSNDIESVVRSAHIKGKLVKVILETGILNEQEIVKLISFCKQSGADYVKTSTGFQKEHATVAAVKLLKSLVGAEIKIKASGGIKSYKQAMDLFNAGADIIGTSSSLDIIREST